MKRLLMYGSSSTLEKETEAVLGSHSVNVRVCCTSYM